MQIKVMFVCYVGVSVDNTVVWMTAWAAVPEKEVST